MNRKKVDMNRKIFSAILLGILLVGVGVFSSGRGNSGNLKTSYNKPTELPEFAYADSRILKAFKAAIALPDVFQRMPCYCGCGDMQHGTLVLRHKNLRDCFIKGDGSFEEHASACELCVVIALDVYDSYISGSSLKEIRSAIDSEYSKYGPSTNTPPV